ncbi:protein of unknown function [Streptomyces murinus]
MGVGKPYVPTRLWVGGLRERGLRGVGGC